MTALVSYSTGTVSVAAGGTTVTGVGTIWSGTNARPGDVLQIGNFQTVISDVTDTTHLVIPPWGGGAQSGVAYQIWQVSPQRFAGAQAMQSVNDLVAALNTSGFFVFVDVSLTVPDPSLGDDGQYAFQPTTGKTWAKIAGVWTYLGIYKGMQFRGVYDNAATYSLGDVQTTSGTSYVYINATPSAGHTAPNATYWQVLASGGAGYGGTSTSTVTIANTGTLNFTLDSSSYAYHGMRVRATHSVVSNQWVEGNCTFSGGVLSMAADASSGSGTFNSWFFGIAGQQGAPGATFGGTSITSLAIGTGSKTFTTQAGWPYQVGARVRVTASTDSTKWMEGVLTTYSGTTFTINIDKTNGSGTFASWNFNVAGQPGAGDLSSANNLSDLSNPATARSNLGIPALLRGHIAGLTLSTAGSSATFGIAAGVATDSTAADVLALTSAYTKTMSAWAVGTGNGAWDGGGVNPLAGGNTSWYGVFLIKRPDTGVVDVLISQAAAGVAPVPNLPTNYTLYRRIGMMNVDGSSSWRKFFQNGDEFKWASPPLDVSATSAGTAAVLRTISTPPGVAVEAMLNVRIDSASGEAVYITDPAVSDLAPSSSAPLATLGTTATNVTASSRCRTNTSSQVRTRCAVGGATEMLKIAVVGWLDWRGADS